MQTLKDKDKRVVAQIMHHISLAANQMRSGIQNPMIFNQVFDSVSGFIEILAGDYGSLNFSLQDGSLVVNGAVFSGIKEEDIWLKSFIALMKANQIGLLEFASGVSQKELFSAFEAISARKGIASLTESLAKFKDCRIKVGEAKAL